MPPRCWSWRGGAWWWPTAAPPTCTGRIQQVLVGRRPPAPITCTQISAAYKSRASGMYFRYDFRICQNICTFLNLFPVPGYLVAFLLSWFSNYSLTLKSSVVDPRWFQGGPGCESSIFGLCRYGSESISGNCNLFILWSSRRILQHSKETSASIREISTLFSFFCGSFCHPASRFSRSEPIRFRADPDPQHC